MADPLSIAASIAGLLALGHTVIQLFGDVPSAYADIHATRANLDNFCRLLGKLQALSTSAPAEEAWPAEIEELITKCMVVFKNFEIKLLRVVSSRKGKEKAVVGPMVDLRWRIAQGDVKMFRAHLQSYEMHLVLILQVAQKEGIAAVSKMASEINSNVEKFRASVDQTTSTIQDGFHNTDNNLQKILSRVKSLEAQTNTNAAASRSRTARTNEDLAPDAEDDADTMSYDDIQRIEEQFTINGHRPSVRMVDFDSNGNEISLTSDEYRVRKRIDFDKRYGTNRAEINLRMTKEWTEKGKLRVLLEYIQQSGGRFTDSYDIVMSKKARLILSFLDSCSNDQVTDSRKFFGQLDAFD